MTKTSMPHAAFAVKVVRWEQALWVLPLELPALPEFRRLSGRRSSMLYLRNFALYGSAGATKRPPEGGLSGGVHEVYINELS